MAVSEVAGVTRWGWTVSRYEKAVELGLFGPEPKVELIEGEVYDVAAMLPPHAVVTNTLHRLLGRLDWERWSLGSQTPIRLDGLSEPEPDVWVARGPDGQWARRHPGAADLALVVEVSDTTLSFDWTIKLPMYAAAGIPEVWLVSIPERTVTCCKQPNGRAYGSREIIAEGTVEFAEVTISLEDLFEGIHQPPR